MKLTQHQITRLEEYLREATLECAMTKTMVTSQRMTTIIRCMKIIGFHDNRIDYIKQETEHDYYSGKLD